MNDKVVFATDYQLEEEGNTLEPWRILIVDDEPELHQITRIVLDRFDFDHRNVEFISAFSGKDARKIMLGPEGEHIALALVDVVMETHHAGLDFVRWVREELDNHKIRLVLRTGQPGEAPEESVIRNYDINDYKNKTELTAMRLKTLVYSALRGYRDIVSIEQHRLGLEKIIAATSEFIECDTLPEFASAILKQVAIVLGISSSSIICCAAAKEPDSGGSYVNVLAMNQGDEHIANVAANSLPQDLHNKLNAALEQKTSTYEEDYFIGYFTTKRGTENLLYVEQENGVSPIQHNLLEFFAHNIAVAHENLKLRELIRESQRELSYVIGEAVEMRSKETGGHVKRVAHCSYLLAELYGVSEYEAEIIKLASPLHDVGKVGIPDTVLNKPGKHDAKEWAVMQTHAQIGYEMLCKSDNPILRTGAVIALQHHEKWDGSGYPKGLAGDDIDIVGRITAVADVFDALGSNRCYKKAWPIGKIISLMKDESGKHFEPKLIDLMMNNIDDFIAVREAFPDQE